MLLPALAILAVADALLSNFMSVAAGGSGVADDDSSSAEGTPETNTDKPLNEMASTELTVLNERIRAELASRSQTE